MTSQYAISASCGNAFGSVLSFSLAKDEVVVSSSLNDCFYFYFYINIFKH
jgi:hypothetical protein